MLDFELRDVDTFNQNLVVTTNRSWATVDMDNRQLIIDAPTPGFTSVLVTACDEANCVERILDLEVRRWPNYTLKKSELMKRCVLEIYSR